MVALKPSNCNRNVTQGYNSMEEVNSVAIATSQGKIYEESKEFDMEKLAKIDRDRDRDTRISLDNSNIICCYKKSAGAPQRLGWLNLPSFGAIPCQTSIAVSLQSRFPPTGLAVLF